LAFGLGNQAAHGPGRKLLGIYVRQFHGLLDDCRLVVAVVDRVVGVQAHVVAVPTQQLGAESVKSAHGQGVAAGTHQPVQPFAHLLGGLVGEGHGQDVVGADAIFANQVGDTVGDNPGFAAAGPGHNQQGTVDSLDCLLLRRVQSF